MSFYLVTGGSSGIGLGIVKELASRGNEVAIVSRSMERLERSKEEILAENPEAKIALFSGDVRDEGRVREIFEELEERWGQLDALINGAAGNFLAPAEELSGGGFRSVMEIDLWGTFLCCRYAFPLLKKTKDSSILNISATLQCGGTPFQVHAASAKAGVDALTRCLATEWGPLGIRVNAVAPGPVDGTEGVKRLSHPAMRKQMEANIPLQRFADVKEIAKVCRFLLSKDASYVTGQTLIADGGAHLVGTLVRLDQLDQIRAMIQKMRSTK